MKNWIIMTVAAIGVAAIVPAQARDTKHLLPISEGIAAKDAQERLNGTVKFYFGKQSHPRVLAKLGSDVTNRKTNAFGKSDDVACNWAFLSALVQLEKRAAELGANAVINIVSYYKRSAFSSTTEFECHAGALMAGVALKGDFVKIANK
jgi:uncharacterized protein YbjQ (UPF0145 family)